MHKVVFRREDQPVAYFVRYWDWEPSQSTKLESLVSHLNEPVEVEHGVTFGDIWSYIVTDAAMYNLIFESMLPSPFDDLESDGNVAIEIKAIELYWEVSYEVSNERLVYHRTPVARGVGFKECGPGDTAFGIELPLGSLLDLPIEINQRLQIEDSRIAENRQVIEAEHPWTVFEMIKAILKEVARQSEK